ncbi:MAG: UdgX family uracil-DNA binding protein [Gammaproteobacteria bacterium]|nr:UdgX family uracil-DNA binding protein [Gammaproteobacteria bacterium]MBV8404325.1 UdgX family uracil-DNA binding protein [Gammaproteobacteria bacterium]
MTAHARPPRQATLDTLLAKPVHEIPAGNLETLRRKARDCHACGLWKHATQTVFGAGAEHARVMLIGEQPGLQEDAQGLPFVGPAGQLLDRALAEAQVDRGTLYVTNTVKHFKYELRGKLRLHKRANAAEQEACRMWLAAELASLQPRIVVALGAMAAQTLFGNAFSITRQRGRWRRLGEDTEAFATFHPSAILRTRDEQRATMYRQLVEDLTEIRRHADD